MSEAYHIGDTVEIVRKGRVIHVGTVVGSTLDEDDGYGKDYQKVRLEIPGLGVRVFDRTVSFRGITSEWRAKARDMRKIGNVALHVRGSTP